MNRLRQQLILLAVLALVFAACGDGDGAGTTADGGTATTGDGGTATTGDGGGAADFTLFGAPTGVEGEALQGFIDVYNEVTGSSITYTGVSEFEQQLRIQVDGGDPPAVAFTPQPASICSFADEGVLVSLEDMGFDIAAMEANHSKYWMDLGLCEDGNHYGIPWFPNYKSIIFYHIPTFEEGGYEVPETYEDMVALSEQMVADGQTPWCFGFGSGDATGWPGTDWIEDILLRQQGADVYAQWYNHEIPFNDPAVVQAFDTFGEIFFGEGFVLGGPENVAGIIFEDSPGPLFSDPAGCAMLKQGSFISNFFTTAADYEEGEESEVGVFNFPTIDGNPGAMGGGDTLIVFDGSPEIVQAVKDWITPEWMCTLASASGGGIAEHGGHGVTGVERLPGHKDVDVNCYESESAKTFASAVTAALAENTFAFDASDLMPPEVGQETFWTGMIDWTTGDSTQEVVDAIEASWPS
ncbi:MAG TPA: ABC transporter substrate-binding protein [Acidimicrobiia bacterium]|nr:ABC transporter substrate-binding protein [Acidimicrobiia bacterium]